MFNLFVKCNLATTSKVLYCIDISFMIYSLKSIFIMGEFEFSNMKSKAL